MTRLATPTVPLSADAVDLADLSRRAIAIHAERDCGSAVRALAEGCRSQSRGGRVALSRQFLEHLFKRDSAGLAEAIDYINQTLRRGR
jgi:hypothetical protein